MRRFKPTEWVIDNKIPVYAMTILLCIMGVITYINLPKEQFPDIVIPTIIVQTIYPGTSPGDIETLISRPIEKQLKSVQGIKKITSQSMPDVSVVVVEFQTNVKPALAKQRVQDAVDKAKNDLPTDMQKDPAVQEIDFSEIPIMYVNISGDIEKYRLKEYAEDLQDKIESMKEITRADIIGALEREFHIDIDLFKMQAAGLTFSDVENSIKGENVNISGGEYLADGVRRNIRLISEFKAIRDIEEIIIKPGKGNIVYLRDIAKIKDDFKEQQSFARLDGKPVVTLSVIKRSGENLIDAAEKIQEMVVEFENTKLPKSVDITITGDRSVSTKNSLEDLINSVIIGFILVTLVLMFFMGVQDSLLVGLAVPISSFLAILIMPSLDYTFNMVVTFSFLLALGIIVDDAIVVIENTHRLFTKEGMPIRQAAKAAAGEVFVPVLTGTLTTLAPFFPLLFFPGISGKFMVYLPVILILTLTASLVVAFFINPVLAADFMGRGQHHEIDGHDVKPNDKRLHIISLTMIGFGILFHLLNSPAAGNFLILLALLGYANRYFVTPILIKTFQLKIRPLMMNSYRRTLTFSLKGKRPYYVMIAMIILFFITITLFAMFPPKVNFFPSANPNFVYVSMKLPIGTDAIVTDSISQIIEERVYKVIGRNNPAVKSVICNVGIGAGDPMSPDRAVTPHKAKITIAFVESNKRNGFSTLQCLEDVRKSVGTYPGAEIAVEQERGGPPTGKPINIEVSGDNLEELVRIERLLRDNIKKSNIEGIEKLNSDLQENKPEIILTVDRARANYYGLSSGFIGMSLRTAVFGKEASKFRDDKDDYPIMVRLDDQYRKNLNAILNMPITFREMSSGQFRQIPISSVVKINYSYSFAGITRKNQKRTITLTSNVLTGFNANSINSQIESIAKSLNLPEGYDIKFTGEQQDQQEAATFLGTSFIIAIFLIMIVLITQFNSTVKPIIIITQVILSTIGVFLGFLLFRFTFSIVVTGVGVVALAGIVVKNGIVLIDFIEMIHGDKARIRQSIIEGGVVRFNPVTLTAAATVLGVVPLAIGFNINFGTMLSELNPHIYVGGDSAAFWGPLAWAIIFGLTFATFLTLVVVPCMYFMQYAFKVKYARRKELKAYRKAKLNA
jgi:multidrug efflux pump